MQVECQLDNLYDLTFEVNIRRAMREIVWPHGTTDSWEFMALLRLLTNERTGGCSVTDVLGHWAYSQGYAGLKFFTARSSDTKDNRIYYRRDHQCGLPIVGSVMEDMRAERENRLLVRAVGLYTQCCGWMHRRKVWHTVEFVIKPFNSSGNRSSRSAWFHGARNGADACVLYCKTSSIGPRRE